MPIETLTRAGATSVLGAREFVHPQDAWPAEEHSDTFCHRALGAPVVSRGWWKLAEAA